MTKAGLSGGADRPADGKPPDLDIREGRHCRRFARMECGRFLIDARAYYDDLHGALCRARRSIFILGWDINSGVRLREEGQGSVPAALGPALDHLVRRTPGLTVRILIWRAPSLFGLEREQLSGLKLSWGTHPRVHFSFDTEHPLTSSHHQKLVVVDDRVAFCGGIDLTGARRDGPAHAADDADRIDPDGTRYGPYHDVQLRLEGEAASALGNVARERWKRATGQALERVEGEPGGGKDTGEGFGPTTIGVVLTEPPYKGRPAVRDTANLLTDLIQTARESIYIENQYLTARCVADALRESLSRKTGPAIVAVLSPATRGWLQAATMDVLRNSLLADLSRADRWGRFGCYHPRIDGVDPGAFTVHSKILIADDRRAYIGSANLNNRSMGLDTECGIYLDGDRDESAGRAIKDLRCRLMAEHLGCSAEKIAAVPSLRDVVQAGGEDPGRGLAPFRTGPAGSWDHTLSELALGDLEKPVQADLLVDELVHKDRGTMKAFFSHKFFAVGCAVGGLVLAAALAAAGSWRNWFDFEAARSIFTAIKTGPYTPIGIMATYAAGAVLFVPVNLLILATAALFDTAPAFGYVLSGTVVNAVIGYGAGRLLGERVIRRWFRRGVDRVSARMEKGGFASVFLVRMLPVAPFSVINIVCGAFRMNLLRYLVGTVAGILPGATALIVFERSLIRLFMEPTWQSGLFFGVLVALIGAAVWTIRRRFTAR